MGTEKITTPEHPKAGMREERTLADISATHWLTEENASFYIENGFLHLEYEGKKSRVLLCRAFPFEVEWEFISVMDTEQHEIGLIRNLEDFTGENRELIRTELDRRYFSLVLKSILRVKEKYGFSYWKATTEEGEIQFTLRDTYRSILKAGENRIIIFDVNGNRFQIPDVTALDRKSYKKIELYL